MCKLCCIFSHRKIIILFNLLCVSIFFFLLFFSTLAVNFEICFCVREIHQFVVFSSQVFSVATMLCFTTFVMAGYLPAL